MDWKDGASAGVKLLVEDANGHLVFKDKFWKHFLTQVCADPGGPGSVLHRPAYQPPRGPTPMLMMNHVPDAGTADYGEVEKALGRIHKQLVQIKELKIVFVFGDQQVRLKHLKVL